MTELRVVHDGAQWCRMVQNGASAAKAFLDKRSHKAFRIIAREKSKAIWRRCGRMAACGSPGTNPFRLGMLQGVA
jgi:hypothetical protein